MVLYLILFCAGKSAKHFLTVYREGPVWSGLTPPPPATVTPQCNYSILLMPTVMGKETIFSKAVLDMKK